LVNLADLLTYSDTKRTLLELDSRRCYRVNMGVSDEDPILIENLYV